MSLNDLAVDLTCEPKEIDLSTQAGPPPLSPLVGEDSHRDGYSFIDIEDILGSIPGSYPGFLDNDIASELPPSVSQFPVGGVSYQVHGGIHKMAMEMGSIGRPVWLVVNDALKRNPSYDLVLCGHSLGAGLCTMLGLVNSLYFVLTWWITFYRLQMWADPKSCRTIQQGGLPPGHSVQVYAFAPPYVFCVNPITFPEQSLSRCILDSKLSKLSSSLVRSFVHSYDVVSRLSLGSVRDMTSAASWLCDADERGNGEGYTGIVRRALMQKTGYGDIGSLDWVYLTHFSPYDPSYIFYFSIVPLHQENSGGEHADGPPVSSRNGVVGSKRFF